MDERRVEPELTLSDASSYINSVKEAFRDEPAKHNEFLMLCRCFVVTNSDQVGIIRRVKELLKGHQELILGYKIFLPERFKTTLDQLEDDEQQKKHVDFDEIVSFFSKIKVRFQDDVSVYSSFLDIMKLYRIERKPLTEICCKVAMLFREHLDLYLEFLNLKSEF